MIGLERKELNTISEFFRLGELRNQFQVRNITADCDVQLVSIDDTRKLNPFYLAPFRFGQ